MNATPAPDSPSELPAPVHAHAGSGTGALLQQEIPGQAATERPPGLSDPLDHPDPVSVAQAAGVENLLRCWTREQNLPAPRHDTLRVPLHATGATLVVPVHYWSPTGWHRFGRPVLAGVPHGAPPVDAVTLSALLAREAAHQATRRVDRHMDAPPEDDPHAPADDGGDLLARVADSVRHTAAFVAEHRHSAGAASGVGDARGARGAGHLGGADGAGETCGTSDAADVRDLFLSAEQSLLLGHPLHPTPKSREGMSEREARRYSPELRGSFPLCWMAVDPSVLAEDSAWRERGRTIPASHLTRRLAGDGPTAPEGCAVLPMHPWQYHDMLHRPAVAGLLDAGLVVPLGPHGAAWHPTSSVRTLYRPGAPAMLKLSLGLRITNSRRENLRKELHRGVEVHRLLCGGLGDQWRAAHPGFDIVRDPAWLAVDTADGEPLAGLDVMIRHNPFGPEDDVSCVAGLVSPRPVTAPSTPSAASTAPTPPAPATPRSRLAEIVTALAHRTGRSRDAVAAEWFGRYLEQVVRPVLWLDSEAGVALEAHQQNTLVRLDPDGWPIGGHYRDNQGYYFRASHRAELDRRLPGIGVHSDTFVSDEVTDERFAYYLGINHVFGLIGAFGSQRLADEAVLLAAFRRFLARAASGPERLRTPLPMRLLDSPVLRCKANLLTRLHGLDELVGPVDTQSVYVAVSNPLHGCGD